METKTRVLMADANPDFCSLIAELMEEHAVSRHFFFLGIKAMYNEDGLIRLGFSWDIPRFKRQVIVSQS